MTADPYRYFRVEARELVDELTRGLLDLDRGGDPAEVLPRLLRHAHTLKGAARVVRQAAIAELAHDIEDALVPFRSPPRSVPSEARASVLDQLDGIAALVSALSPAEPDAEGDRTVSASAVVRTVRSDAADLDVLLDAVGEARAHLDELHDAVAALGDRPGGAAGRVGRVAEHLDRELAQMAGAAEDLRLVPARLLFTDLERAARDLAGQQGRSLRFEAAGGDVRLEAELLDAVRPALVQAVRNAVAHGLEGPDERRRAGKHPEGVVAVRVARRGRDTVFTCRDDGRGIDEEAVRATARAGGLDDAGDLADVLGQRGLSTSATVTELSGRGVGLDVAREASARLGGRLQVRSAPRQGTTLELAVPASAASFDALTVEVAGQPVAIPLDRISRVIQVRPAEVAQVAAVSTVVHDGTGIPYAPLAGLVSTGRSSPAAGATTAVAVVVEGDGRRAALAVDRLIGSSVVVGRPLPGAAVADPAVAGIWLDRRGVPRVVVDPDGAVAGAARTPTAPAPGPDPAGTVTGARPILVVDDSLTTRMLEQSILESAGFEVVLAASGEEALTVASARPCGLFLVDVEMPGMDGFTFVERVRSDPALRDTPAVLVTSRGSEADRRRGVAVGADAHLDKAEFDQADLLDEIRRLLARAAPRRAGGDGTPGD